MNHLDYKIGHKFGRLTLVEKIIKQKGSKQNWKLICECGKEVIRRYDNIISGNTTSCNCFRGERIKIGLEKLQRAATKYRLKHLQVEYSCWVAMIQRCTIPENSSYKNYGGRGIKVCDRWLESFENFYEDMGPRPPDLSIERKDVNGDYYPDNCIWATAHEQARNKRNNKYFEFNGMKKCLYDWALYFGVAKSTMTERIKSWGIENTFIRSEEIKRKGKRIMFNKKES